MFAAEASLLALPVAGLVATGAARRLRSSSGAVRPSPNPPAASVPIDANLGSRHFHVRGSDAAVARSMRVQGTAEPSEPRVIGATAESQRRQSGGRVPSASLMPHIEASVRELLQVPIADVMVGAWCKLHALRAFRGPKAGHGEVSLVDPSVEASYRPALTVTIAPPPPMPWSLELKLTVDIGAVTLGVRGGKIRRARPASSRSAWRSSGKGRSRRADPDEANGAA